MPRSTFGDHLVATDAERFVGRAAELERLEGLLARGASERLVFVHGPGGIGKSTLLRALARRAGRRRYEVVFLDGRDLDPVPDALEDALEPAFAADKPLLLLDTWERMAAVGTALRTRLLPALPPGAVVVIAGRQPPEAGWFSGGWESLVGELPLRPMRREDAIELVLSRGVAEDTAERIVRWADGSPLALTIAADAAQDAGGFPAERPEEDPNVLQRLLRRVIEHELDPADADLAAVAALGRRVTPEMVSAVLPGVDGAQAVDRLLQLSFAEETGFGVRLHDLARRALRAELRARDADRERDLRRRMADHLYARVLGGEARLIVDLVELVDNPALRWGFGAEGSPELRIDGVRPGVTGEIIAQLVARGDEPGAPATALLIEQAPERVILARDSDDRLCGFSVFVTTDSAPPVCEADPLLGPWLEHARAQPDADRCLVWRDAVDFTADIAGDPASPILALMNTAVLLRSGIPNPRHLYLPINPENGPAVAFAQGVGAVHHPELDTRFGSIEVQCHIFDTGEAGLIGAVVAAIYAELELEAPEPPEPWVSPVGPAADAEDVRDALKSYHRPGELAANPLAEGATPEERVAFVRTLLEEAVAGAFGDSDDEGLQRRIVELGYFDATTTHEAAADVLHLSRAAYFRRLRQAVDRVADWVLSRQG
jgi:NADPH-dependent ferric siderophore reductase